MYVRTSINFVRVQLATVYSGPGLLLCRSLYIASGKFVCETPVGIESGGEIMKLGGGGVLAVVAGTLEFHYILAWHRPSLPNSLILSGLLVTKTLVKSPSSSCSGTFPSELLFQLLAGLCTRPIRDLQLPACVLAPKGPISQFIWAIERFIVTQVGETFY